MADGRILGHRGWIQVVVSTRECLITKRVPVFIREPLTLTSVSNWHCGPCVIQLILAFCFLLFTFLFFCFFSFYAVSPLPLGEYLVVFL